MGFARGAALFSPNLTLLKNLCSYTNLLASEGNSRPRIRWSCPISCLKVACYSNILQEVRLNNFKNVKRIVNTAVAVILKNACVHLIVR